MYSFQEQLRQRVIKGGGEFSKGLLDFLTQKNEHPRAEKWSSPIAEKFSYPKAEKYEPPKAEKFELWTAHQSIAH